MNIEERSLHFDHVLTYHQRQLRTDWQEGILLLEDFTLIKDVYQNGPVIFSVAPEANEPSFGDFTYYLPINEEVVIEDDPHYGYKPQLHIERSLVLRQADEEIDFYKAYEHVEKYAEENNIILKEVFYCVLLKVYGEYIIDLYVPIEDGGGLN